MNLSQLQRGRLQELAREAQEILSASPQPGDQPMTFAELEEVSIEAGDIMTAVMMQAEIETRSLVKESGANEPPCCPTCEQVGELQAEQEARVLQTDRGEVTWLESTYYCRRCRRSFFPDVA